MNYVERFPNLKIVRLQGQEIVQYIPELVALRLNVLREYPYLYDGDVETEYSYFQPYICGEKSIVMIAKDKDEIVGISSGLPLADEQNEIKQPFIDLKMDINKIFYFSESGLFQKYRGYGIGKSLFEAKEQIALREGSFNITTFSAIQRSEDDHRKPKNYKGLDGFWMSLGYEKHTQLKTKLNWKELNEEEETSKFEVFWLKRWC